MNQINRTREDLKEFLNIQLQFIINSCNAFDSEFEEEAIRLAAGIRVMLHDTVNSTSLLGQLNLKNIKFHDSATDYNPQNRFVTHGLVGIRLRRGKEPIYDVRLDKKSHKMVSFDEWWNKIVIVDNQKNKFTRRNLILNLTNKEGGAHVDPSLDQDWYALTRQNSIGRVLVSENGSSVPLASIVTHSMRQIAFEVLETLKDVV